jgi:hypothetical protein
MDLRETDGEDEVNGGATGHVLNGGLGRVSSVEPSDSDTTVAGSCLYYHYIQEGLKYM